MNSVTYTVPSIHCGHCVHTIQMELGELDGVKTVNADMVTKQVTVEYLAPASPEKIEKLMAEIDYPVLR